MNDTVSMAEYITQQNGRLMAEKAAKAYMLKADEEAELKAEARYQIERAIAQLVPALDGVYDMLPDTVDSVIAQLRAYLRAAGHE